MERNTSKVVSGPLDRDMSTLEMAEGKPNGSAEAASSTGPDMPKSTARTATDDMSKSTSKEASSWRRRLPQHSFTMLPNARAEPRPFINKYFFKRPRLLQYYDGGALVDSHGNRLGPTNPTDLIPSRSAATEGSASSVPAQLVDESHAPETSKIQRDWLNLFIDLLWVGIVSNISSSFVSAAFEPASSWGYAFLEFAVLFITAFRFWSYIRKFLNNFFNKDFTQSLFLTWVLVLALFFGNQTPYFLDPVGGEVIIATFLTAKGSFILVEALYCIFIPSMRREFLLTFLISIPVAALWGASVAVEWPARAALILPAVLFEGVVSAIIALPLGDWFLHGAPKKALDPDNFVERLQGFFIIVLGEGVYALISGDNWGVGLSAQMVFAIESLIVYYSLFWLFFMGDQTKTYIHAIYRNRYTSLAFQL
jgi:low temperature requirement protein LtrA